MPHKSRARLLQNSRFDTQTNHKTLSPLAEINTTPLIDVMLVLLVIFILAAPLVSRVLWSGLAQTLPNSDPGLSQKSPKQTIQVQIDPAGFVWLQHQNSSEKAIKYTLENKNKNPDPTNSTLQQKLTMLHQQTPDTNVVLYADQDTRYALVAKALEQARAAGFNQIAIATQTSPNNRPTP